MGKRYLIDGYNLLLRWRRGKIKPGPGNLERAREALIEWIGRSLADAEHAIIVFDAGQGTRAGLTESRLRAVRVVFAVDFPTADDWIIEECRTAQRDPHLVVVSNDRQVQFAAQRFKIAWLSCEQFLQRSSEEESPPAEQHLPDVRKQEFTKDEVALTEEERALFRESTPVDDVPGPLESNAERPTPDSQVPPARKPHSPPGEDLSDFYRQMRDFDPEKDR